jgi:phosphatidylglycerol:prolipoprotein diacylglycerol transferase
MHPILFTLGPWALGSMSLGPLTLRTYGLMMALSFVLGLALAGRLNRREGRSWDDLLDLGTWIMLGAVVGARILYCIVEWPQFQAEPWTVIAVWQGGLVYYGGLIGAALTAYGVMRVKRMPVWAYADVLAPGLALGQVTGRLGCWFNGCCYGRADRTWGVVFPALGDNIPRLPVMLYEAAFCLLLSAFLYWFWARRRFVGQVFWVYVLAYAAWRFGIEFLRGDPERGTLVSDALSPSQWISLVGFALAGGALFYFSRRSAAPGRR